MRGLAIAAIALVAISLSACGDSTAAESPGTTMPPIPTNVEVGNNSLIGWGESSGVRWFFSEPADAEPGMQCSGFDSDPPVRRSGTGANLDPPQVVIGSKVVCRDYSLAFPSDAEDRSQPIAIIENARSHDGKFSVLAGVVAENADEVQAEYPDGTETTARPDRGGTFVMVSRPPKSRPDRIVVRSGSRESDCGRVTPAEDSEYFCDPTP